MKAQLDLIGIVVEDMGRALAFYRELGLELPEDGDGQPHVEATLPGGLGLAWDTAGDDPVLQPGLAAGHRWSADRPGLPRRLARPTSTPPMSGWSRSATTATRSRSTRPGASATRSCTIPTATRWTCSRRSSPAGSGATPASSRPTLSAGSREIGRLGRRSRPLAVHEDRGDLLPRHGERRPSGPRRSRESGRRPTSHRSAPHSPPSQPHHGTAPRRAPAGRGERPERAPATSDGHRRGRQPGTRDAPTVIGASTSALSWALTAPCTGSTAPAARAGRHPAATVAQGAVQGIGAALRPNDHPGGGDARERTGHGGQPERLAPRRRASPSRRAESDAPICPAMKGRPRQSAPRRGNSRMPAVM